MFRFGRFLREEGPGKYYILQNKTHVCHRNTGINFCPGQIDLFGFFISLRVHVYVFTFTLIIRFVVGILGPFHKTFVGTEFTFYEDSYTLIAPRNIRTHS